MAKGTVKWINDEKGFGYITPEGGGDDVFASFKDVQMDGYQCLDVSQEVEFDIVEAPTGKPQARNIRPL